MSVEENKAIVRRYIESLNEHNLDAATAMMAPAYTHYYGEQASMHGPREWKKGLRSLLEAFPEFHETVEEMFAQGDKVAVRGILRMTHTGREYRGLLPTGRTATFPTMRIFRVTEGRIAGQWVTYDTLDFWQQLDVVPPLKELIEQANAKQS